MSNEDDGFMTYGDNSTIVRRSTVVVGALLLALAVAGCGGSGKKPAASPTSQAPTQSTVGSGGSGTSAIASQPMALVKGTGRVDLLAMDRSAANTVTIRWRVTNISSQQVNLEGAMERESAKFEPD